MAFATIRGARILSLFKCPLICNCKTCTELMKSQQHLLSINAAYRDLSSQCVQRTEPVCDDRFKTAPCESKTRKEKLSQPAPPHIEEPELKMKRSLSCCGHPCPDVLPRFDKLYYRRSDKRDRSYQQTWDECAEMLVKPKLSCCREIIKPKLIKRGRKERPQTASKQEVCLQSKTKCPHLDVPDCKAGRKPPTCLRTTKASNCQKPKPPYPAFSECKGSKFRPVTNHCTCLLIPSICEVWAYYNRQHTIKKPTES